MDTSIWTIFFAALGTAVATGLGAVPFLFLKDIEAKWLGLFNGVAAGLMLAASHSLMAEGGAIDFGKTLVGVLIGLTAIVASDRLIDRKDAPDIAELEGAHARKALLILGVMTAHSFAEGIGGGVSFGDGKELGLFITIAIAIHNIPEGLAISLVLIPRGTPVWKAGFWSIFTSLPQPIMALPAFLFVMAFKPFLKLTAYPADAGGDGASARVPWTYASRA